jgi:mannose-1-phosphate guanylyltransferase / mannose-6-phosphate isomerase
MKDSSERNSVTPVVLCGGSGTRLWPLSRKSLPKQFVPLVEGESLLTLTLKRLQPMSSHMILVASEEHRFMLTQCLNPLGVSGDLILEPFPKNTAAAMAMAALWVCQHQSNETLLLFCPSDHFIPDTALFDQMVKNAQRVAAEGAIVTFGVQPTYPSTAYGYIHAPDLNRFSEIQSSDQDKPINTFNVTSFVEKPQLPTAESYVLSGKYLWNAGIFLLQAGVLLDALATHAPAILSACQKSMQLAHCEPWASHYKEANVTHETRHQFIRPDAQALSEAPSKSIDFAVMEHHQGIQVLPFQGQWSDVGSWNALSDLYPADAAQNRIIGEGLAQNTKNTFIHAPNRRVVALGVQDLLIIDTVDALLVANRASAEDVKDIVSALGQMSDERAVSHRKVERPWGWFDSIDSGERFKVKRIGVHAGASLSLQKHHHRAEHWIVVQGVAEVTKGEEVFLLEENQSTYISLNQVHRLRNPGPQTLEMIEVQSGSYLGEDDIVRLEDNYGRI